MLVSDLIMRCFAQVPILLHCFNCVIPFLVQIAHPVADDRLILCVVIFAKLNHTTLRQGSIRSECLLDQAIVDILFEFFSELVLIDLFILLTAFF